MYKYINIESALVVYAILLFFPRSTTKVAILDAPLYRTIK